MRDNEWLRNLLIKLWNEHFFDVSRRNNVCVRFSRVSKTRLGSIRMARDKSKSVILLNGIFKDPLIPSEVVEAVLAHEITHYAHGFSSPLPKRYSHPHRGGVVKDEMIARGLGHQYMIEKNWTKANWRGIVGRLIFN